MVRVRTRFLEYFTEAINGKSKSTRGDFTASRTITCWFRGFLRDVGGSATSVTLTARKTAGCSLLSRGGVRKPAVAPSEETVINGSYQPLARPIFIYVNAKSAAKPEVKEFVEYYMKNGEKLTKEVKYISLPAKAYTYNLEQFCQDGQGNQVRRRKQGRLDDRSVDEAGAK